MYSLYDFLHMFETISQETKKNFFTHNSLDEHDQYKKNQIIIFPCARYQLLALKGCLEYAIANALFL